MEILEFNAQGVRILGPQGRLDALTSKDFLDKALAEIAAGHHRLLVDCSGLSYISSAGLRALYRMAQETERMGGALALCAVGPDVRTVLDMVDLASDVPMHSDRVEALAAMAG